MKTTIAIRFAALLLCAAAHSQEKGNPRPLPDDLALPIPGGGAMIFRPVFLDVGDGMFALREFTIGSRAGESFRETPTRVQLGGSFIGTRDGKRDWLYYVGKYEVTADQFSAVMGEPAAGTGLPKVDVSWAEVLAFTARYNAWLFENARAVLPAHDGTPGFVRLPTEPEWEFAARGGIAVDAGRFDQRSPYAGDLARYEWFAGPRSSHDKLKPAGRLDPNPLGLHDMLGNASEWVHGLYQIEYLQGRAGGLITRGGDFRTPQANLRSSARTEQRPFDEKLQAFRLDSVGFRLVIASPIFTSLAASQQIESAWTAYAKTRAVPMPGPMANAAAAEKTGVELAEIERVLQQLEAAFGGRGSVPEAAQSQINLLRASYANIAATIGRAEALSADGGVRLASVAAYVILRTRTIYAFDLGNAATLGPEEMAKRTADTEKSVADAQETYTRAFKQLSDLRRPVVEEKFDGWIAELQRRGLADQAAATGLAKRQYGEYAETKRLNFELWIAEFLAKANENAEIIRHRLGKTQLTK